LTPVLSVAFPPLAGVANVSVRRNIEGDAGRARLLIVPLAFPIPSRIVEIGVLRERYRHARAAVLAEAALASPTISGSLKIAVHGNIDSDTGFVRLSKTAITFPAANADTRVDQKGVRRQLDRNASIPVLPITVVALPTAPKRGVHQIGVRWQGNGCADAKGFAITPIAVPATSVWIVHRVAVCGNLHGQAHALGFAMAIITFPTASVGLRMGVSRDLRRDALGKSTAGEGCKKHQKGQRAGGCGASWSRHFQGVLLFFASISAPRERRHFVGPFLICRQGPASIEE